MGYLIAARKQVVDGEPPPILLRVVVPEENGLTKGNGR